MVKDNAGNLYISDANNGRILKYDLNSSTWVSIGEEGTEVGQFSWPEKIGVDGNGNLYVADYSNDRIQKYDIGTSTWSVFLNSGTGIGQVSGPYVIHFDNQENFYVGDSSDRIQKYDIGTSTWSVLGTRGTLTGKFYRPTDFATDNNGNLYVADSDNDRIQKYDIGTSTWSVIGDYGSEIGQFDWPTGLDFDSNGDLYVADGDNSRLQKYNVGTTTWEVVDDYFNLFYWDLIIQNSYPYGIYIDRDDNIYAADIWNDRLQVYDSDSNSWSTIGAYGSSVGQFGFPEKIEKDNLGNFYVIDSDNDRIQKYDIGTTSWSVFLDSGTAVGQVKSPSDIRIDNTGNIYLSDLSYQGGYQIKKYDIGTTFWSIFAVGGTGLGQVKTIGSLGVDMSGNFYVSDVISEGTYPNYIYTYRLQKYDVGTSQWSIFAIGGTGVNQFKTITDIDFDSFGNMYLIDDGNKKVRKHDTSTNTWSIFGTGNTGNEPGDFSYPKGILVDNLNNVYITEADSWGSKNYIHKFDVGTSSWFKLGSRGFGPNQYIRPLDLEIDQYSNLYTIDNGNHRVQKLWYYNLFNYFSSDNGSITGLTSQKLSIGQSGTQVVAIGNSGYAFLKWSDGSITNPRVDIGSDNPLSVTASFTNTRSIIGSSTPDMEAEVTRNFISIGSTNPAATPNFTFNINYTFLAGEVSVVFPAQTVVTPVGSSIVDLTQFVTIDKTLETKTQLSRTLSSVQFGIPNFNLSFSSPVTVTIPLGNNYNNQTLQVKYQKEGETSWNDETICLILNGNCTFQTDHATTFVVLENVVSNSNNNNNNSPDTSTPDNSCHSSKPQLASDLFQIDTTKNTAKIFFTPQIDTNDYFISFSSQNDNAEEHGERVNLLREGVQSHTIYSLKPNTTYYIKVRGQNGCMPGDWSNIMTFKTNSKIYYRYFSTVNSNLTVNDKQFLPTISKKELNTTIQIPNIVSSPSNSNNITDYPSPVVNQPAKPPVPTQSQPQVPKKRCFLWWCW